MQSCAMGGLVLVEHARGWLPGLRGADRMPTARSRWSVDRPPCPQVRGAAARLGQPGSTARHPAELARRPPPPRLPERRSSATGGPEAGLMGDGLRSLAIISPLGGRCFTVTLHMGT